MKEKDYTYYPRKKDVPRPFTFEEAKLKFDQRYTMEHVPQWAHKPMGNGMFFGPQYRTDREWYENTKFVGEYAAGQRDACMSCKMSWPLGRSLYQMYKVMAVLEEPTININENE